MELIQRILMFHSELVFKQKRIRLSSLMTIKAA